MARAKMGASYGWEGNYVESATASFSLEVGDSGKTFILKDSSVHNTDTNIFWSPRSTGWSMFYWNKIDNSGSDRRYVDLYWNGTTKGSIKYSTSGTIDYNTTSDYRLKDNIKDKDREKKLEKWHDQCSNVFQFMMDNFQTEMNVLALRIMLKNYNIALNPRKLKNFSEFAKRYGDYIKDA